MKSVSFSVKMQATKNSDLSLGDVDDLVDQFLKVNDTAIQRHWTSKNSSSQLGYAAFLVELRPKLRDSCIAFLNSNLDLAVLGSYLFPTVITAARREQSVSLKKVAQPICPGCKFLGLEQPLASSKFFKCSCCEERLKSPSSAQLGRLSSMFSMHNKSGYSCPDCQRFIPHPLDSSRDIVCPYFDCSFVGNLGQLVKMKHPVVLRAVKILSLDQKLKDSTISRIEMLESQSISSESSLELKETANDNLALLKDIIDSQISATHYTSSEFTRVHYISVYEAFQQLINEKPNEMISYLIYLNRGESLQCKIFQEYISILEKKLPFGFRKNGKVYKVSSLLDESLCLFDGISNFETDVTDKKEIKNKTKEFYIGGRSGAYSKPYYIGKLLDVIDKNNGKSIMSDVEEYSFSKIKLKTTAPNTTVKVIHLRVAPHYQMGGMCYLNRIRRKIVDKAHLTIHGFKREIKK